MQEGKFKPVVGLKTDSCYFPLLTELSLLGIKGTITHIGSNYFILKPEKGDNILIKEEKYPLIKDRFYGV